MTETPTTPVTFTTETSIMASIKSADLLLDEIEPNIYELIDLLQRCGIAVADNTTLSTQLDAMIEFVDACNVATGDVLFRRPSR